MATTPYEIIAGPAKIYAAPLATAFVAINDADPTNDGWTYLGDTDGGVKVKHSQNIELLRTDQGTGPQKAIRSEEALEVYTNFAKLTLENFAKLLNDVTVGTTYGDVKATLTTALTGANNDLKFTADTAGSAGNNIRVRYVDPGAPSQPISVSVSGNDITVNLATNGSSVITSTATDVKTAVDAHGGASALVDTANAAGNDGTGVVTAMAYTNLTGGADGKDVKMYMGKDAAAFALLVRGPSPYGNFNLQYEVPICVQTDEPEAEYVRDNKAVLAAKFCAIEDPAAASEGERFGRLIAQTS